MNQGRRRRAERYHAPVQQAPEERFRAEHVPPEEASASFQEQPSWQQTQVWEDEPYEPQSVDGDARFEEHQRMPQVIATDRTICLSCTLAALTGLSGLFLFFAEEESSAIRHFAVQSMALSICLALCGLAASVVGATLGSIPLMGFVIRVLCWLAFAGAGAGCLALRVRMMLMGWRGVSFTVPVIGTWMERRLM